MFEIRNLIRNLTLSPHSSPEAAALLSRLSSSELSSLTRFDPSFTGASRRRFGFDAVSSALSTLVSRSDEGLARDLRSFKKPGFTSDLNVYKYRQENISRKSAPCFSGSGILIVENGCHFSGARTGDYDHREGGVFKSGVDFEGFMDVDS